jgi:hypothetical protein
VDCRIGVLCHEEDVWRICDGKELPEHGQGDVPQGVAVQHVCRDEVVVRSRLDKQGSVSYATEQVIASVVAIAVLAAIFVPFQKAEAYTVNLTLPNASTSAVPTSAVGSTFKVTVDVAAGELISVSQIELILDNGNSGVKQAFFNSNGQRTSGDPTLARGNLDITIPTPSQYGYGYGYGLVSSGSTFSSPY